MRKLNDILYCLNKTIKLDQCYNSEIIFVPKKVERTIRNIKVYYVYDIDVNFIPFDQFIELSRSRTFPEYIWCEKMYKQFDVLMETKPLSMSYSQYYYHLQDVFNNESKKEQYDLLTGSIPKYMTERQYLVLLSVFLNTNNMADVGEIRKSDIMKLLVEFGPFRNETRIMYANFEFDDVYKMITSNNTIGIKTLLKRDIYKADARILQILDNGDMNTLESWYKGRDQSFLKYIVNYITYFGYMNLLKHFLKQGIYPNTFTINSVLHTDNFTLLDLLFEYGLKPDIDGANSVASDVVMIKWLLAHNIVPNVEGANIAAGNSVFEVVNMLSERGIYPDIGALNKAAEKYNVDGFIQIMDNYNIEPDIETANIAAGKGYIGILNILSDMGIFPSNDESILTNIFNDKNMTQDDILDILEWLTDNYIDINGLGDHAVNYSVSYGNTEILDFLVSKRIFPDSRIADCVENIDILIWLEDHNIRQKHMEVETKNRIEKRRKFIESGYNDDSWSDSEEYWD